MCSHGVAEGGGRGAGAGWAERIARKRRGLARRGIGQRVRCPVLSRPRVGDSDLAGGAPPHGGSRCTRCARTWLGTLRRAAKGPKFRGDLFEIFQKNLKICLSMVCSPYIKV